MDHYYDDSDNRDSQYNGYRMTSYDDLREKKIRYEFFKFYKLAGALKFADEYIKRSEVKNLAKRLSPYFEPKYTMGPRIKQELKGVIGARTIERALAELGDEYIDQEMKRRGKMAAEANKMRGKKEKEAKAVTTAATIQKEMFGAVKYATDTAEASVVILMRNGFVIDVFSDRDYDFAAAAQQWQEQQEQQQRSPESLGDFAKSEAAAQSVANGAVTSAAGETVVHTEKKEDAVLATIDTIEGWDKVAAVVADPKWETTTPVSSATGSTALLLSRKSDSDDSGSHSSGSGSL